MADSNTSSASSATPPETTRTARLADTAESAAQLGIVGPRGSGAGEALRVVAERTRARGDQSFSLVGRRLEKSHAFGALAEIIDVAKIVGDPAEPVIGEAEKLCRDRLLALLAPTGEQPATLLVDEAQWLDEATLRVLVGVVERAADRNVRTIVAHRPVSGDSQMATLDAALSKAQPLCWLSALEEADVAERAAGITGRALDAAVVEALHERTAGAQYLVDLLARAWIDPRTGRVEAPPPDDLPGEVIAAIRTEVDQLPDNARTVLSAVSVGADLDDELLGEITSLTRGQLGAVFELLRSAGLVSEGVDEVIPVIAEAVMQLIPEAERRRFHVALAEGLAQRKAPPMQAAEHLAAAGSFAAEAAVLYLAAGEACLPDAPELAKGWFDRAASAGADASVVAARIAEAAAYEGDASKALRLADQALTKTNAPERARALGVVAALLPARGYWERSSATFKQLDEQDAPNAKLFARIGALIAGKAPDRPNGRAPATGGSLAHDALALALRGLEGSLDQDNQDAQVPFLEAAELFEAAQVQALLPDSPHALGATVALAMCDLTSAEHLLTRALERNVGGRALASRHRLLLGWVSVRLGRWSVAQSTLDDCRDLPLAPREQLFAAAIDAGLARRGGDLTRLNTAWQQAEGVLLRHPADLLTLDPFGELAIAASRLGRWDRMAGKARELGNVVRDLGEPPLWLLPLRWAGLQVALAADDQEAVPRRAAEVKAINPVHPRLSALHEAAGAWVEVMEGEVDPPQVTAAANGLQELSLAWEASRLTGQAAIRATDQSTTRSLLEQARDLKAMLPSAEPEQIPSATSVLSDREQMVAQHVVDGLTYKEIGAQLYISPKTVEHHVAKIRQKLGASTRAEMLAALRTAL